MQINPVAQKNNSPAFGIKINDPLKTKLMATARQIGQERATRARINTLENMSKKWELGFETSTVNKDGKPYWYLISFHLQDIENKSNKLIGAQKTLTSGDNTEQHKLFMNLSMNDIKNLIKSKK